MRKLKREMNKRMLQMFADDDPVVTPEETPSNIITTSDLEPAISVDFTTRITENIRTLQEILGIVDPEPMAAGTLIKIYKYSSVTLADQVEEGEEIALTKVERTLAKTIELTLKKYRKQTTAEAIQKTGRSVAVNGTDSKLVSTIRGAIKKDFFTTLEAGTGTATGVGLQATLAAVWGKLQKYYDDMDITPVFFVSSDDVADYLGSATVNMQTVFGFTYIENFLGLGTAFVNPNLTKGKVVGTAKENLRMAYVPANGGDLAESFDLIGDESGLVGMTHSANTNNATVETLVFTGIAFYPEYADGVIVGTVTAGA